MDALDKYKIDLKNLHADSAEYCFRLDDAFFEAVQGTLVKGGEVDVVLKLKKNVEGYTLTFCIKGRVCVPCDRCLEDMYIAVETTRVLTVVTDNGYEEDADVVVLPKDDTVMDVAWILYEFVVLEVPITHVHADGECNPAMLESLSAHLVASDDESHVADEESRERPVDPRWNELKKILDNN